MKTVGLISLGCARNLLDSEVILGSLKKNGFTVADIEDGLDVCVINTCAFIESARKESIDTILQAAEEKKEGRIKYLVVCGCMPQLYKEKLAPELKEVDLFLGTSDYPDIARHIKALGKSKGGSVISRSLNYLYDHHSPRYLLTPEHYAYVKISEGCSNFCSYCIIARLRGAFRSRSISSVCDEVKDLTRDGKVKELILIGQDTTHFGMDRYGKIKLAQLLRRICAIKGDFSWVRLLYTHPAHYTNELELVLRDEPKICKYLDLPIQHISDKILKSMNRRTTRKEITELVDRLRRSIPGIVLRTSIIVGFPGETEKDFRELLDFIRQARFERCGSFLYSREEGTRAARLEGQVSEKVKRERMDELMKLQQKYFARN